MRRNPGRRASTSNAEGVRKFQPIVVTLESHQRQLVDGSDRFYIRDVHSILRA